MKDFIKNPAIKFMVLFLALFAGFYYFNLYYFAATSPASKYYVPFLANNLDYIKGLRWLLLQSSKSVLNGMGFTAICDNYYMLVAGHGAIMVVYQCLGIGVMCFFTAFVIAYPKNVKAKIIFILAGLFVIQLLNAIRFMLLAVFVTRPEKTTLDHHTIFNFGIYLIIAVALYFWVNGPVKSNKKHAANRSVNL